MIVIRDAERLVLIDGYLRVEALRRLHRDTAVATTWPLSEMRRCFITATSRSPSARLSKTRGCSGGCAITAYLIAGAPAVSIEELGLASARAARRAAPRRRSACAPGPSRRTPR